MQRNRAESLESAVCEIKCVFASVMHYIRPEFPVCDEAEPAHYGTTRLHQEDCVQQQKLPTHHPGLCQRHDASV